MKRPPARRRSGFDSVPAYTRYDRNAKIRDTKPVHQSLWSIWSPGARSRIHAKTPAAIAPRITRIPVSAAEDSFTGGGIGAANGSPAQRVPAGPAELEVPGVLRLAARARERLGRPALSAELQAGGHGLPALDAGLARGGSDRHVRAAGPAELLRHRLLGPALRAHLHLLGGLHLAHLARHRVSHADPCAEAEPGPRAAARVRGRRLHRVRERVLLRARGGVPVQDATRGGRCDGRLHGVRERDAEAADLDDFKAEVREVGLRLRQDPLLDLVEVRRELRDLHPAFLHLPEGDVDLLHEFLADPVLDFRRGRGPEGPDELVHERLRRIQAVPELAERPELDEVEVRVFEDERLLRAELPVEDPLLEVVHLRLLDDPGEDLLEPAQDRDVLRREGVPVGPVEVCEDLSVAVEDRDLVLPDDDVVVHPDVPGALPHDVVPLERVVPRDRHRRREALAAPRGLVRPPSATEQEYREEHLSSPPCPR